MIERHIDTTMQGEPKMIGIVTQSRVKDILNLCASARDYCHDMLRTLLGYLTHIGGLRTKPENKPLYEANALDMADLAETKISKIIGCIFRYQQDGQYILLQDFADCFLSKRGFDTSLIRKPRIETEWQHIDVLICEEGRYSIIIENKLKGAPYQRNQLARYIHGKLEQGYREDMIFVVLLPNHCDDDYIDRLPKSVWRLPPDRDKKNDERRCTLGRDTCKCWCDDEREYVNLSVDDKLHCKRCRDFMRSKIPEPVALEKDFADWITSEIGRIDEREVILTSAMRLFADYLCGQYRKRINDKLIMDITDFLSDKLLDDSRSLVDNWNILCRKIDDANALVEGLEKLQTKISGELVDEWYGQLNADWPQLSYEPHKSFSLLVKGVLVGCWYGEDNYGKPYWGFLCRDGYPTTRQLNMVRKIFGNSDMPNYNERSEWVVWDNIDVPSQNGAEICHSFYLKAKELGYLK